MPPIGMYYALLLLFRFIHIDTVHRIKFHFLMCTHVTIAIQWYDLQPNVMISVFTIYGFISFLLYIAHPL